MTEIKYSASMHYQSGRNTILINLPAKFIKDTELKDIQPMYFYDRDNKIYLSLVKPIFRDYYKRNTQTFRAGFYKKVPLPIQLRNKYIIKTNQKITITQKDKINYLIEFEYPLILRDKYLKERTESVVEEIAKVEAYLTELKKEYNYKGEN